MHKMGKSVNEVFEWYAEKTKSKDAESLYSAIKMQAEIGGSEAAIMQDMASSIQKRIKTRSEINSSLTETNITLKIFDIAPFCIIAMLFLISPDYLSFYFNDIGHFGIMIFVIALFIAGSFVTRIMKSKIQL